MERDRSVSLFAIELTTACFGSDAKIQSIFVVSLHRLRELICECKLYIVRLRKLPRKLQTDHLNSKFWDGRRSDDDSNYLRLYNSKWGWCQIQESKWNGSIQLLNKMPSVPWARSSCIDGLDRLKIKRAWKNLVTKFWAIWKRGTSEPVCFI